MKRDRHLAGGGGSNPWVCWTILSLFWLLSALGLGLRADTNTNAIALSGNDWRQLWNKESREYWQSQSESKLLDLAEQGQPAAQFLYWTKFRKSNREKAGELLDAAAKAGLPQATFARGFTAFLSMERGPAKRLEAWEAMVAAAETGYPMAKFRVAEYETWMVSSGGLVKPNLNRALRYLRECVDAGYLDAMVSLSVLYSSGIGNPRSESDSPHRLLQTAADGGSKEAMGRLAERYAVGHGEARDSLEAARLFFLSGVYGEKSRADLSLVDSAGEAVVQGTVVWDDVAKALSLFVKAAVQREPEAAHALAQSYREAGKLAESVALLRFAASLGNREAEAELKRIEPTLTPDQRSRTGDQRRFPFVGE